MSPGHSCSDILRLSVLCLLFGAPALAISAIAPAQQKSAAKPKATAKVLQIRLKFFSDA